MPTIYNAGRRLHRLPPEIVLASLREDIADACESEAWLAAVAFSDGKILLMGAHPAIILPAPDQMEKMLEVAHLANQECDHDGHWVVAWAGGQMHAFWRDRDGDMQVTQTFVDTWARLKDWPREVWVEILDGCYDKGMAQLRIPEIKPGQTYRRALGEKKPERPTRH